MRKKERQLVLNKGKEKEKKGGDKRVKGNYQPNPEELSLLRTFYKFPEVVQLAGESYSPNLICNYLYDLAQKYNGFYNQHRILGEKNKEVEGFRLSLTKATGEIIKSGLYLLGIKAPEKM